MTKSSIALSKPETCQISGVAPGQLQSETPKLADLANVGALRAIGGDFEAADRVVSDGGKQLKLSMEEMLQLLVTT